MFFFGIMGIGSGAKPAGEVWSVCPLCGNRVRMNVARSYSYFHFFFIPLFKFGVQYFATCPGCASVYGLNRQLGDNIRSGSVTQVNSADLTLMKNNRDGLCPGYGHRNPSGSTFCNHCGRSL